jgi:hypothetical protein
MTATVLQKLRAHLEFVFQEMQPAMSTHHRELAEKAFRLLDMAENGLSNPYENRKALDNEISLALTLLGEAGLYG